MNRLLNFISVLRGKPKDAILWRPAQGFNVLPNQLLRLQPLDSFFRSQRDLVNGKTVLDLASNAGHFPLLWSELGAKHVVAVEGRSVFNRYYHKTVCKTFPVLTQRITWIEADIRGFIPIQVDVVSCLGLLYHVPHAWSHIKRIVEESKAKTLILESMLWSTEGERIELGIGWTQNCLGIAEKCISPTTNSVERQLREFGWTFERCMGNWSGKRGLWIISI